MGSQLVVAVDDGIELVFHLLNVQGIQQNDLLSSAIGLDSEGSLSDVRWENLNNKVSVLSIIINKKECLKQLNLPHI